MPSLLEISANLLVAGSIWFAARNSVWTWWLTFVGCGVFGYLCWDNQLYADFSLQLFFIGTAIWGLKNWQGPSARAISSIRLSSFAGYSIIAIGVAIGYGLLLHYFTDAYAPFWDSLVLTFSVLAQFMLVRRYLQNWWCWLLVNSIAIPLYYSRGLELTAAFYLVYWFNAWYGLYQWRGLYTSESALESSPESSKAGG